MDAELASAIRETARLEKQAHQARVALRRLQDQLGRHLGTFEFPAGTQLDAIDLIEFLRVTVGAGTDRDIRITVHTPIVGTDKEDSNEKVQRGRANPGAGGRGGHDRRDGVPPRQVDTGRAA